ncbi:MAG: 4Fe-4S dicluster domain-containing protein, partial [Chloroflexi bacterium]|nr:4Fe-4S dicluster domain-containing protein [Chloroflexota bacterium]
ACDACINEKEGPQCIRICQFNAIDMKDMANYEPSPMPEPWNIQKTKAFVDTKRCWGCLSCALVCPSHAITAKCVRDESWVPEERVAPQPKRVDREINIMRYD